MRINNLVSEAKLEELNDSLMEAMIGNTEIHEQMDVRLGGEGSASGGSPLDILKRRYASGEINEEEYERMAEHLRK